MLNIYIYIWVPCWIYIYIGSMYVCMYVCMYACMHVCMYACMHVCMYACMHVCMYACMHVCMYACMHVCMYAFMHVCMYACMHVCMYACMHVCMYACMHVCMYACMHVCMYACMHVCMYACMHVCMYVCIYVCMYVCIYSIYRFHVEYIYIYTYIHRYMNMGSMLNSWGFLPLWTNHVQMILLIKCRTREPQKGFMLKWSSFGWFGAYQPKFWEPPKFILRKAWDLKDNKKDTWWLTPWNPTWATDVNSIQLLLAILLDRYLWIRGWSKGRNLRLVASRISVGQNLSFSELCLWVISSHKLPS